MDLTVQSSGQTSTAHGWGSVSWNVSGGANAHIIASSQGTKEGTNNFICSGGAGHLYGRGHGRFSVTFTLDGDYTYTSSVSGTVTGITNTNIKRILPAGTYTISGDSLGDSSEFSINVRLEPVACSSIAPEIEQITNFGTCGRGSIGPKIPTWGSFGPQTVLEADSGEKLEVACGFSGIEAFFLYYTPPGGNRLKVGSCPFLSGCNSASFIHSGDNNNNGKPDCFLQTRWISRDYGNNDKPNAWTGESDNPLENVSPDFVDLLDWAESMYEINIDSLTKISRKYEYQFGPPVIGCMGVMPEGNLFNIKPITNKAFDPPLGPITEAFFNSVAQRLQDVPSDLGPMEEDTTLPCDFDRNGSCDDQDRQELREHIGACVGDLGYNPLADADGNGCLTITDEEFLFLPEIVNQLPAANAGINQTAECTSTTGSNVTLDGSGSSDPDGDALTYTWTGHFGTVNGQTPIVSLPLGTHALTLEVRDPSGEMDTDIVSVTVEDTVAPDVTVLVSPDTLWPPNHKMVPITPTASATDICDSSPIVSLSTITTSEGDETNTYDPNYDSTQGDGNTTNDIVVDNGNISLRAERSGVGDGRVYAISYTATDSSGNTSTTTATVSVSHNQ